MACPFHDQPPKEPVLQTGDIQADVLLGVNMKSHLIVAYLDIVDADKAKAWLRERVLPAVTTADNMRAFRERFREARRAEPGGAKPVLPNSATLNVSFSFAGLKALEAPELHKFEGPNGFGTAFSLGLEHRAGLLGDVTAGAPPSDWVTGARTPHVLLQLGADAMPEFERLCATYAPAPAEAEASAARLAAWGVRLVHADSAHRLNSLGSEHFGFHDALSNPALRGFFSDGHTPLAARTRASDRDHALPGQDLVYPGDFVLLNDRQQAHRPARSLSWRGCRWGRGGAVSPS